MPDLKMLARISPVAYGPLIVARNRALLKNLELLRPYVGHPVYRIPSELQSQARERIPLGCPHCRHMKCDHCLWARAMPQADIELVSCDEDGEDGTEWCGFGEFEWGEGTNRNSCSMRDLAACCPTVMYSRHGCSIQLDSWAAVSPAAFRLCEGFLKAHVEWASSPDWGKDAVPDPFTDHEGKECDGSLLGFHKQAAV